MDERWDNHQDAGEEAPAPPRADTPPAADAPSEPPQPTETPEPKPRHQPDAGRLPADSNDLLTPGNYNSPLPPPELTTPKQPDEPRPQQQQSPQGVYIPPPGAQPQQPPPPGYPHQATPGQMQPGGMPPSGNWPPPTALPPQPRHPFTVPVKQQAAAGSVEIDGATWNPAGLGLRVTAFLLDAVILALAGQVLVMAAGIPEPNIESIMDVYLRMWSELLATGVPTDHTMAQLNELIRPAQLAGWLNVAMCFCYYTAFHWLAGGSLGKLCLGLRVLRRDGRRLSLGWAALRYLGYFLCAKLVYTAWLVPMNAERRTLYDIVLSTNVFKMKR